MLLLLFVISLCVERQKNNKQYSYKMQSNVFGMWACQSLLESADYLDKADISFLKFRFQ